MDELEIAILSFENELEFLSVFDQFYSFVLWIKDRRKILFFRKIFYRSSDKIHRKNNIETENVHVTNICYLHRIIVLFNIDKIKYR